MFLLNRHYMGLHVTPTDASEPEERKIVVRLVRTLFSKGAFLLIEPDGNSFHLTMIRGDRVGLTLIHAIECHAQEVYRTLAVMESGARV